MKNYKRASLLLSASILGLTLATAGPAFSQCTQTVNGTQTRSVSVYCVDHKSRRMTSIGLTDGECDRWNHLASPGSRPSHATSQSCTYQRSVPCPPPPYSGDGGGDGHTGGGWVDTDGDGRGDTRASEAPPGNYNSSNTRGGSASGRTDISSSGWVSGTHDSGFTGRSSEGRSSGGGLFGGLFGGGSRSSGGGGGGDGDGGGGCFVTTAVVDVMGEADDGPILTALRHLRDAYTVHNYRGTERIKVYYEIAPKIVFRIQKRSDAREIWESVYEEWIAPIHELIDQEKMQEADKKYSQMVLVLTGKYLLDDLNPGQKRDLFLNVLRIL